MEYLDFVISLLPIPKLEANPSNNLKVFFFLESEVSETI